MNELRKNITTLDPAEWIMIFLSWMIYLGGIIFFSQDENAWASIALGALPILVSAWSLGMTFGAGSAAVSIIIHLLLKLINPENTVSVSSILSD